MQSKEDLGLGESQRMVDAWIKQFEEGYFPPMVQIARLVEELGELARAVSHETGHKIPKAGERCVGVEEELGDLFFVLICFANSQNISLEEAFRKVLSKIDKRDKTRWHLKHSDPQP